MESSSDGSSTSSSTRRPTWTLETPRNPSAGSARSTAMPCGSRMPALGRVRTRARTALRVGPADPVVEGLAGDALVGLDVELARAGDDVVRDRRRRRRLVPAARRGPVADVLLVEGRLPAAGLVAVGRPVARRVGRQDLVPDHELAVG